MRSVLLARFYSFFISILTPTECPQTVSNHGKTLTDNLGHIAAELLEELEYFTDAELVEWYLALHSSCTRDAWILLELLIPRGQEIPPAENILQLEEIVKDEIRERINKMAFAESIGEFSKIAQVIDTGSDVDIKWING